MTPTPSHAAHAPRPWYREPWPWILMAGPLLAMIGCGVTIWLANTHADVPVQDASRHGLVVEKIDAAAGTTAPRSRP
ncbi:FixH family protein [Cupriavidus agavae]|uniref:FixH family protein n=1 Tax=Cupriavidus agavae TaxID=1001822 RepID=A0A4Q7S680_9BURK|nr:FixH family protein [Cupriavidus agavae]RZT41886.1 hypothetical protein EV147_0899 [Cupriavidus agavae]